MVSPYLHSARWKIAYMGLLNGFMIYLFRTNMNMTLPSMIKSTSDEITNEVKVLGYNSTNLTYDVGPTHSPNYGHGECQEVSGTKTGESKGGEFSWDKKTQAFVLSSYYYGFLLSQIPFGMVVGRFGGKRVVAITMSVSTVLTVLVPVLARTSVYALITGRAVLGFCTGAPIPAWYTLLSRWALPDERSRFTGMCWLGNYLGTIVGFFTTGFLCAKGFDNGWGSVYYIHGIVGVIFVCLWQYIVVEHPEKHPRISQEELQQLTIRTTRVDDHNKPKTLKIPWLKILTHVPVLAIFVTHILDCFVHYLVLICLPLYMKTVLKFDIQSNGAFSSLPFISSAAGLFIAGIAADSVIKRKWLTVTATRKLAQVIALLGTAVCICLPGFMTCNQRSWVIVCLCAAMFLQALGYSAGFPASPVDIAPRFASLIFSISNTFCTISGVISPLVVAQLTNHDTVAEWRIVFFIATGCALVGAVVFGLFASSERAPWAEESTREIEVTVDTKELHLIKPLVSSTDINELNVTKLLES